MSSRTSGDLRKKKCPVLRLGRVTLAGHRGRRPKPIFEGNYH
jgi:hypothetical protein